jgi:hypothetical protein
VLKRTWEVEPVGIVGIEEGLDGAGAFKRAGNRGGDPDAGHVGEFLIHEETG